MKNSIRFRICGVFAVAFVITAQLWAAEYMWSNDAIGNSVTTAYLWSDGANWDGETPPGNSASDHVAFTNCAVGTRFVQLSEAVTFNRLDFADTGYTCLMGDRVTAGIVRAVSSSATAVSRVYADLLVPGAGVNCKHSFGTVAVCGDVAAATTGEKPYLINSVGHTWFRYDLYANSSDPKRVDPSGNYVHTLGWGTFHFIAPHGSDEAVTAEWTLTEGSRYAVRAGAQSAHVLCAGTAVTSQSGALDSGTFLKRIFDDGAIELSSAAKVSDTVSLTFAPFAPEVEQTVYKLMSQTATMHYLDLSKQREKDVFRYTAENLEWRNHDDDPTGEKYERMCVMSSTGIPGTLVVKDGSGYRTALILDDAHIEFGLPSAAGIVPGLPNAKTVRMKDASGKVLVTTPENVQATVNGFTGIAGELRKNGAGTLVVNLKDSSADGAKPNSGSISVEEGVMRFVVPTDGVASVATLNIAEGAGIEVSGTLEVTGTFSAAAGVEISGSGKILLPADKPVPDGLSVSSGVTVAVKAVTDTGRPVYDYPDHTAGIPGDPAFWVEAGQSTVFASGSASVPGSGISRWNDVRGTDARYMFATNTGAVCPTIETNTFGHKVVKIANVSGAAKNEIGKTAALVWDKPIHDIRHVFLVAEVWNNADWSGGMILGSSPRIATDDFYRANTDSASGYSRIVSSTASDLVKNAAAYFNGIPVSSVLNETPFPYTSYSSSSLGNMSFPLLIELELDDGVSADCFGFSNTEDGNNGRNIIHECVIYTNKLTVAERLQAAECLMVKHMRAHVNYERFGALQNTPGTLDAEDSPACDVETDGVAALKKITGSGTFLKTGGGELYVDDMVTAELDVNVREGRLAVRSVKVSEDDMPVEPVIHLDAGDASTTDAAENGGNAVTMISDRRGAGYPVAVCRNPGTLPLTAVNAVGGKTMIDFGDYVYDTSNPGQAMQLKVDGEDVRYLQMRSTLAVIGTAKGGGFLAGDLARSRNYNQMGGIWRNATSYANGMISDDVACPGILKMTRKAAVRWRLNGADVANATSTGFSGGYDLVSMASSGDFGMNGLNACHYGTRSGGQELGEQLFFDETLSSEQVLAIEAYLRAKWFGTETDGYRGSRMRSLDVAAGAEVAVCGNVPLKTARLSGSGVIDGGVAIDDGGVFGVTVAADGSVDALTVGEIDLSGDVTVVFSGDANDLVTGRTVLISSASIKAGTICSWSVPAQPAKRFITLSVIDGALVMDVAKKGLVLSVR